MDHTYLAVKGTALWKKGIGDQSESKRRGWMLQQGQGKALGHSLQQGDTLAGLGPRKTQALTWLRGAHLPLVPHYFSEMETEG